MNKYRKKPVIIEAVEFVYPVSDELRQFLGQSMGTIKKARHAEAKAELEIYTLEDGELLRAKHIATEGDFIIKGVQGEFYPCKPDIFKQTYELVT